LSKRVKELHEQLGRLLANKGVPPFVLANNISLNNYDEVSLYKRDGLIIVDMFCRDEETNQPLQFRYKYDSNEVLLTKEMIVAGRSSTIWDREQEILELKEQIEICKSKIKI
jgi:hypothetical protein